MILGAERGRVLPAVDAFEFISVDRTQYAIGNAEFNSRFLIRNKFTKARVT